METDRQLFGEYSVKEGRIEVVPSLQHLIGQNNEWNKATYPVYAELDPDDTGSFIRLVIEVGGDA
jgi:hypothetical protein